MYFEQKELLEKRGSIIDRQEALLKKAKDEKRDFTDSEQEEFDNLETQYSDVNRQLNEGSVRVKKDQVNGSNGFDPVAMYSTPSKPEIWETKEGRSLRVYKPGERISRSTPDVGLGQVARAMLTGARTEAEKRALSEGTDSSGGFTVPSHTLDDFFDRMRAKARVIQAGARTINLETDETTIARVSGDPTIIWHEENAEESASDATFEGATFKPKTLMILVRASRELIADSVNANEVLESVFAGTVGAGVDEGILFGSNANGQMKGLTSYDLAEVDMGTDGADLTNYDPLVQAYRKMLDNNSSAPSAYIMAPREWETLSLLKATDNQPLQRPQALEGIPFLDSTNIPTDETHGTASDASRIVTGNWSDLVIGLRSEMRIELLRERYADSYQFGFLVHMRVDALPAREESFAQIVGISKAAT